MSIKFIFLKLDDLIRGIIEDETSSPQKYLKSFTSAMLFTYLSSLHKQGFSYTTHRDYFFGHTDYFIRLA
ncbi:MAG: hypothetical protein ACTSYI_16450 [Promethearchaeota archaeon]